MPKHPDLVDNAQRVFFLAQFVVTFFHDSKSSLGRYWANGVAVLVVAVCVAVCATAGASLSEEEGMRFRSGDCNAERNEQKR